MKNAIMIRMTKPISIAKLPDKSESDTYYRKLMEQSTKAEVQAILESNKLYGHLSQKDINGKIDPAKEDKMQSQLVAWAFDVKIASV